MRRWADAGHGALSDRRRVPRPEGAATRVRSCASDARRTGLRMAMIAFDRNAGIELRAEADSSAAMEDVLAVHLTNLGLPANRLELHFDLAAATMRVSGCVDQQDQRERIVLCSGNVLGIAGVEDGLEVIMPSEASRWRFVQPGDTFESIAHDAYRDAARGQDLRRSNQPLVGDVEVPTPGWLLRIPPLDGLTAHRAGTGGLT